MKNNDIYITVGILSLLMLFSIVASHSLDINDKSNLQNTMDLHKQSNLDATYDSKIESNAANAPKNDGGCTSVIVHDKQGHDVVAYRRDSGYSADILIDKINFNGQNAIKEYKTQGGYFSHTIITENGWIINIGGKDEPNTNERLEKLGSDIISKGIIEENDVEKASSIIKQNGWGHFVIKSPSDDVGITAYDYRVSYSMTKLFKMKDGDYIKVPNNPRYYKRGKFNRFSNDPTSAAIKIIGRDIYGQDRRNVITYDYNYNLKSVAIWASFDGGALLGRTNGNPDNIQYIGKKISGKELPKIPGKKYLGNMILHSDFNNNLLFNNQRTVPLFNSAEDLKYHLNVSNV